MTVVVLKTTLVFSLQVDDTTLVEHQSSRLTWLQFCTTVISFERFLAASKPAVMHSFKAWLHTVQRVRCDDDPSLDRSKCQNICKRLQICYCILISSDDPWWCDIPRLKITQEPRAIVMDQDADGYEKADCWTPVHNID